MTFEFDAADLPDFSPRQWEVIDRLLAGRTVNEIATDLGVVPDTVKNAKTLILRKLGPGARTVDLVVHVAKYYPGRLRPVARRPDFDPVLYG